MSRGLRIAPKFSLPLDVAGEAIAILAKRGAGKTNTATVLVEELYAAGVQVVVLDPVGAWWGLRSSADGKGEGLPIARLGGEHGDVPLEQTAGALIADVAVDTGESLLLDLSDFPSKAAIARFTTDFAERLYRRKARARSLLHVVLEEADEFAPQKVRADVARMTGAIEQIVRRGRGRGLGITMVTQRSAVLNKDVLEQVDVLVAMRTTGPNDRAAIKRWVEGPKGDEGAAEIIDSLNSLETGEAWVWNPEREIRERVQIRRRQTFDSSSTPKAGEQKAEPRKAAAIDLTALGEQIKATAERAEASDPRKLQARVRELERKLAEQPAETETVVETVVERVEVPVLNGQLEDVKHAVAAMREIAESLTHVAGRLVGGTETIAAAITTVGAGRTERASTAVQPGPSRTSLAAPRAPARRPAPTAEPPTGASGVSGPQQRILDALAWFEAIGVNSPKRTVVAAVAGVSSKSSGFRANVSTLSGLGLVSYPIASRLGLTAEGRQAAAAPPEMPTPLDLHEAVYGMVSGPQASLLRALVSVYPNALSREDLAERAGVSPLSSGFRANVSTLSGFELITYPGAGYVAAAPLLFLEGE